MESEELVLEGHKYKGRFKVEEKSYNTRSYIDGGYAGARWANTLHKYFEGQAVIINMQNNNEQRFLVCPKGKGESHLIILGEDREKILKRVQDYKAIVDLSLEYMYENARDSVEIILKTKPPVLNIESLVELGLLRESSGQGTLSLSVNHNCLITTPNHQ